MRTWIDGVKAHRVAVTPHSISALGRIRTFIRLLRKQVLHPLSYERWSGYVTRIVPSARFELASTGS